MNLRKESVYFPSLNGIRFIAAALVFAHHFVAIDFVRKYAHFTMEDSFFAWLGGAGVTLFFVLSGYLITYLLLAEYKNEQKINIKDFYIRRVLRIWPLYFFTIAINLFYAYFTYTLSLDFFATKFFLYLFFLPNVASIIYISGGFPGQLWSVGSEEQFYLFWPWIVNYFRKNIKLVLILIPIIFFVLRFFLHFIVKLHQPVYFKGINVYSFLSQFSYNLRVDCMAIGGCFAWLFFNKSKYLNFFYSKQTQYISLILTGILLLDIIHFPFIIYHPVYSILFGIIILNVSTNQFSVFNLKQKLFEWLGTISYGLYMFHPFVLKLTDNLIEKLGLKSLIILPIDFMFSFGLTILLSYLSFKYLESPFLKLKHKFSKIISGNEVQPAT